MNSRLLSCVFCLIGFPATTQAAIWHVDDDNTTGVEDGSVQHPFDSLQEAIAQAAAGDQIRLAAGSYGAANLLVSKRLALLGGYPGAAAGDYAAGVAGDFLARDCSAHDSHLMGTANLPVLRLEAPGANGSRIEGLRIGGGLQGILFGDYPLPEAVSIANNTIEDNGQGAAYPSRGGGLAIRGRNIAVTGNRIRGNRAELGAGVIGDELTDLVFADNRVLDNVALGDHGGGAYLIGTGTVSGNLFAGNEVGRSLGWGWGGGLIVLGPDTAMTIAGNEIRENFAPSLGGGAFVDDGAYGLLENNLIFANETLEGGAGIYVDGAGGHGPEDPNSSADVVNCTVANNRGGWRGGNGLIVEDSDVVVRNSIFWGNSGGDGDGVGDDFAIDPLATLAVSYSISEQGWAGGAQVMNTDPRFADPQNGDYSLQSVYGRWDAAAGSWVADAVQSPGIDAGDPADGYGAEPTPNGGRVNLGAFGNSATASLGATPIATFDPVSLQTHLPVVAVGALRLDVTLGFSDGLFRLSSFALTALETAEPAAFDAASGLVDIPRVEVLGSGDVFRAQLQLVDPALFTFALGDLAERD